MGVLTLPSQRLSKHHKPPTCSPTGDTLRPHPNTPRNPTRRPPPTPNTPRYPEEASLLTPPLQLRAHPTPAPSKLEGQFAWGGR